MSFQSNNNELNRHTKISTTKQNNKHSCFNSLLFCIYKCIIWIVKNSLHELIEKINKCKAYFIRCIKPSPSQENVFANEFVVKQLRYCSIMHVCKIRKSGYPYRIKYDEFLNWFELISIIFLLYILGFVFVSNRNSPKNQNKKKRYRTIEICIIKCAVNVRRRQPHESNKSPDDEPLQKCLKCLQYANITNYKVNELFIRFLKNFFLFFFFFDYSKTYKLN